MSRMTRWVGPVVALGLVASGATLSPASAQAVVSSHAVNAVRASGSLGTLVARVDVDGDSKVDRVYLRPGAIDANYERVWTLTVLTARGRSASARVVAEAGEGDKAKWVWKGAASLDGVKGAELLIAPPFYGDFPPYVMFTWRSGKLVKQSIPRDPWWLTPSGPGMTERLVSTRSGQFTKTRYQLNNGKYFALEHSYRWNKTAWKLASSRRFGPVSVAQANRVIGWRVKGFARF